MMCGGCGAPAAPILFTDIVAAIGESKTYYGIAPLVSV
jgi:hypothetical protein